MKKAFDDNVSSGNSQKKKILFVCIENSNRSQMAEAFAKILGEGVDAYSAGSNPSGKINPKAIAAMKELGYDLNTHHSKSLEDIKQFAPLRCGNNNGIRGCLPMDAS
ncbi:MAG TPA: hypothetical protein VGQ09_14490 [Chitinophagaceae bacterium]|jgi:predicted protein tyrosine phosphatase|nr:hypothetical protein [Chitinophagaceae bacterium]